MGWGTRRWQSDEELIARMQSRVRAGTDVEGPDKKPEPKKKDGGDKK